VIKNTIVVTFTDIDTKKAIKSSTCNAGSTGFAQVEGLKYVVTFKINQENVYSSFINSNNPPDIEEMQTKVKSNVTNVFPDGTFQYQAFIPIYFFDTWAGSKKDKVTLSYTIEDQSDLPIGDIREVKDSKVSGKFVFVYDESPNPTKMINLPTNPEDKKWYNLSSLSFQYAVGEDLGADKQSDYDHKIIREELNGPFANNMFTLLDLFPSWLSGKNLISEQEVVEEIFTNEINTPYTWSIHEILGVHIDAFDGEDTHRPISEVAVSKLKKAFLPKALNDDKAGYKINQLFKCGNTTIGSATIEKRIRINPIIILDGIKKTHQF
jgi:hypothetical protein